MTKKPPYVSGLHRLQVPDNVADLSMNTQLTK